MPEEPAQSDEVVVQIIAECDDFIPSYATDGSAGLDLVSSENVTLEKGQVTLIPCGFGIALPPGYEAQIRPRSGLSTKGLVIVNSPGTVDSDYRGQVLVPMTYQGLGTSPNIFRIMKGTRIAQMVIQRVPRVRFEQVSKLPTTDRGEGGFGSTGTQPLNPKAQ